MIPMAKSKEQKQQEALERKQSQFQEKLAHVKRYRPDGDMYNHYLNRDGPLRAEAHRLNAEQVFGRYLREAQLNSKGEPYLVTDKGHYTKVIVGKHRVGGNGLVYDISYHLDDLDRGF